MSDDSKRRNEWAALLDAWPAPQPPSGFAARVLAACATPPLRLAIVREPMRRRSRGTLVAAAALAAALILLPLAFHRHTSATPPPSMVSVGDSADLGSARD